MTNSQWNSIKEKFSKAYLHAVCAKANYALDEAGKDYDGLAIDYSIVNRHVGTKRTIPSESEKIKVQLKGVSISSESMFKEERNVIQYRLSKSIVPVGANHYLVEGGS